MDTTSITHTRRLHACKACAGTRLDPNDPSVSCRSCTGAPAKRQSTTEAGCAHQWRRALLDSKLVRACTLCYASGEEYEWRKHWRLHEDMRVSARQFIGGRNRRTSSVSKTTMVVESEKEKTRERADSAFGGEEVGVMVPENGIGDKLRGDVSTIDAALGREETSPVVGQGLWGMGGRTVDVGA